MNITIEGVKLEVEFDYYPGYRGKRDSMGVPEEPDEGPEVEIQSVTVKDIDILPLLDMRMVQRIEEEALRGMKEDAAEWKQERYWSVAV